MPRGKYDRAAARDRRARPVDAPKPVARASIVRDENWGNRQRKIKGEVNYRELIPESEMPGDAIYQWKTIFVLGKVDENKLRLFAENGWSPVPHSRHPYMPKLGDDIVDNDAILMEQPMELYHEALDHDERARDEQMSFGKQSLNATPAGNLDRRDLGTSVKTAPMAIPADDSQYQRET